ncbi:MAG: response regulator [Anaerolineae bacterium]|jgi:putative two-component system response regulator|nr:response regulator [Anaerolineae bacterium]MBT7783798.1 response regulator [Anaerolineae bacterium]
MQKTILIVDDEFIGRQTLESVLDGEGYTLKMAESGSEALEKASLLQPDLILLDVMMPGMTGYEVCARVREDKSIAEIPIIILTALDDHKSMLQALKSGADDFLSKPFDRHELRARVAGIMRVNRYKKLVDERTKLEHAHAELIAAYDSTILGWSKAMDLRDRETEGHSQRVADLSVKIARVIGIGEHDLTHMRRGTFLHDMGKLGIPDSILHKKGKLTKEEWIVMKTHPIIAYDMLSAIEYLHPALDIPYSHHERWDGSGYPRGLKGTEIPLVARIFAVVDVWDALLSNRPYRKAWSKEKTLAHIQEESGKHFDPDIVAIFMDIMASND